MTTQCTRKSGAWLDNDMVIQFGLIQAVTRQEQNSRSQASHEKRTRCGREKREMWKEDREDQI